MDANVKELVIRISPDAVVADRYDFVATLTRPTGGKAVRKFTLSSKNLEGCLRTMPALLRDIDKPVEQRQPKIEVAVSEPAAPPANDNVTAPALS